MNSTNSSFTSANEIFNTIYTDKSMLVQLLLFYFYLYKSSYIVSNSKEICDFIIRWESTHACICTDISCDKISITGNLDGTFKLPNSSAVILNNYYTEVNGGVSDNIIDNNSIFKLLTYATNVYSDILLKINYYLKNLDYCEKDYMNINNIPNVYNIYNNFYKNELETLTYKDAPLCFDYIPILDSLTSYLFDFNKTYKTNFPDRYFIKNIILKEGINAIIVYTNVSNWNEPQTVINYYYYYITIYSPIPIQIFNINDSFPTSETLYTNIVDFVYEFNTEYILYYNIKEYILINNYENGGFYPKGGIKNNSQNIGYLYMFDSNVNTYIYETLESYAPYNPLTESNGKGVALSIKL